MRRERSVWAVGTLWVVMIFSLPSCNREERVSEAGIDGLELLPLNEEFRIGDRSDPDLGFSLVSSLDVDRDGNLFVMEASVPEIRVFNPEGELLRRIGQRGQGPGEFGGAPRFGVEGDTVWAVDGQLNRITLFDREGNLLSTGPFQAVQVPLPQSHGSLTPWVMRPDGSFTSHFSRITSVRPEDAPTGVEPTDSIPVPFLLFDASGAVTDTVGWAGRPPPRMWRPPWEEGPPLQIIEVAGRRAMVPRSPTLLPWWEPMQDGYILIETPLPESAERGVLHITRRDFAGDTLYSRSLQYSPVPYTSSDLDEIARHAARGEPGGGVGYSPNASVPEDWETVAPVLRAAMDYPEFKLLMESPWIGQDGTVWLRRSSTAGESVARWILLDAKGLPQGEVELPAASRLLWSGGDFFWSIEPDEYEVPWLVKYRIGAQ